MATRWTKEETDLFDSMSDEEIAEYTGRPITAVTNKRRECRLKGVSGHTTEYIAYDRKGQVLGSAPSIVELAEMIGKKPGTIMRALSRYEKRVPPHPLYARIDIEEDD